MLETLEQAPNTTFSLMGKAQHIIQTAGVTTLEIETISRKDEIFNNKRSGQVTHNEKSWYVVGFADGEGSENCSWRKRDDFLIGWRMSPVFNISQKDRHILLLIKNHLNCGTIRPRKDGVWAFEVDNQRALLNTIVIFFKKHSFLSEKKKRDFQRFQNILNRVHQGSKSKTYQDISDVLQLVADVEAQHARKYTDGEILSRALCFWTKNQEKIWGQNKRIQCPGGTGSPLDIGIRTIRKRWAHLPTGQAPSNLDSPSPPVP